MVSNFRGLEATLRILTFTTLWPNSRQPVHGLFVRERVLAMVKGGAVISVIAPVPWVPFGIGKIFYRYEKYDGVEETQTDGPFTVYHPRFITFPKMLKFLDGWMMAVSVSMFLIRKKINWDFDVIDAHWLYPDGTAALLLGRVYRTPVTVTVRGDDIRTFSRFLLRRLQLRYTLRNVLWVWAVCEDLKKWVCRIVPGLPSVEVSLNGVDTKKFHPINRSECRELLGLPLGHTILITVGRIEPAKGQMILMEALGILAAKEVEYQLVLVGPVDDEDYVKQMRESAAKTGLGGRIVWAGPQGHESLINWLCAADIFLLASENEGCPNSLLEAMACQVPAVVTPVGGVPELINEGDGCIFVKRTAEAFARGIEEMTGRNRKLHERRETIHNDIRSWDKVAEQILGRLDALV